MKRQGLYKHKVGGLSYEKTGKVIGSMLKKPSAGFSVSDRKRVIPKMLTHPIKTSPHF